MITNFVTEIFILTKYYIFKSTLHLKVNQNSSAFQRFFKKSFYPPLREERGQGVRLIFAPWREIQITVEVGRLKNNTNTMLRVPLIPYCHFRLIRCQPNVIWKMVKEI